MEAYLSPIGSDADDLRRIVIEDSIGVYRDGNDIVATVEGQSLDLGIRDPTVSRRKDGSSPVQFFLQNGQAVIKNAGNTNGVTIDTGIRTISVDSGATRSLVQDCTVEIGFNTKLQLSIEKEDATDRRNTLSVQELQEKLGIEEQDGVISGVDPAAHVRSVTTNLRREAQREATNECLKFANELDDFVEQRPTKDDAYDEIQSELSKIVNGLERKLRRESLKGTGLDAEWQERIERVTQRIENMYARADV
jgi:hypothetical protein